MNKLKVKELIRKIRESGSPVKLTDPLLMELIQKGYPEFDLRFIQKIGGYYDRMSDTFFLPPSIRYPHKRTPHPSP